MTKIAHEAKLAYTLTDGRRVETCFEDSGDGTRVSTVFEAEEENSAELQRMGWQAILDNFKQYAEARPRLGIMIQAVVEKSERRRSPVLRIQFLLLSRSSA